ncbi:MAG TPA: WD40 repeat domain-containing protein [Pirellulales bacterium]
MLLLGTLLLGALPAGLSRAAEPGRLGPGVIQPEPLARLPDSPLGQFALVSQPLPLDDALSWTIETRRPRGELISLAISPDGRLAAIGGDDTAIRIWDIATGKLVRTMLGHDRDLEGVAWSPDGGTLVSTGGTDCTVRLWDARTSMPLRMFEDFDDDAEHVAWSPDGGRFVAAGGNSGWIWLWQAATQQGRLLSAMGDRVASIDWSPDGRRLAVAVGHKGVSIIDAQSGKTLERPGDDQNSPAFARWSPNGRLLAVGSETHCAVYEMPGAKRRWEIARRGFGACWSPDSSQLMLVLPDRTQLVSAADGKTRRSFETFMFDLRWVGADRVVGINTTQLCVWQPSTGTRLAVHELGWRSPPVVSGVLPLVTGIATTQLVLWNRESGRKLRTLEGHTAAITAVAWTRKGDLLASAADDHTVRLWDPATGRLLRTLDHRPAYVMAIAWSPDGKTLASGATDHALRLWSADGNERAKLRGHQQSITALAWAPRGNLLASGGADSVVRLWDPAAGKLQREIPTTREVYALAFSPNGSILAGGTSDAAVQLWQTVSGRRLNTDVKSDEQAPAVRALSWSPDGKIVAVGRENAVGHLWDWRVSSVIDILTVAEFRYLNWSSNGKGVVGGDLARTAYFWDRASGIRGGVIVNQGDHVLLISPEGFYRAGAAVEPDIVFVVQTPGEQLTLTRAEFMSAFGWRNNPSLVKLGKF